MTASQPRVPSAQLIRRIRGEFNRIGQRVELQPRKEEARHERTRAVVGQHPLHLSLDRRRFRQLIPPGFAPELGVGLAVPQQAGEPRGRRLARRRCPRWPRGVRAERGLESRRARSRRSRVFRARRSHRRHRASLQLTIGACPDIWPRCDLRSVELVEDRSGRRPQAPVVTGRAVGAEGGRRRIDPRRRDGRCGTVLSRHRRSDAQGSQDDEADGDRSHCDPAALRILTRSLRSFRLAFAAASGVCRACSAPALPRAIRNSRSPASRGR